MREAEQVGKERQSFVGELKAGVRILNKPMQSDLDENGQPRLYSTEMRLGRTAEARSYVIEVNPPFQGIVVLRATLANQNPEDVKAGELTIELREDQAKELAVELLRYCWRGKAVDAEQMLELLSKAKR